MVKYITELLYRYDCVIVPEFGAFITNTFSASIDNSGVTMLPPRKEVSFNEQLKQNDGLLLNHLTDVFNCSYEDAQIKLSDFIKDLKESLISGSTITFDNLGDFNINNEGKLQFNPFETVNFLTSSFGLSSISKAPTLREILKEQVEELEEKAPIVFTPEKRKSRPYLKYAAAAVIGLGILGFTGNAYMTNKVNQHNIVENEKADKQVIENVQEASFFSTNPIKVPEVTLNVTVKKPKLGKYHIVAGAFRFEENAHKKINQLKEQGFKAKYLGKNRFGLHQVVYASLTERIQAIKELRKIKKEHNRKAWLLVKDLDK